MQVDLHLLGHVLAEIEKRIPALESKMRFKVLFVCEEILTNLARHADFADRQPVVSLSLDFDTPEGVLLTCRDNAVPFDMRDFPTPELSEKLEEQKPGGLGIYLIKKYAKAISYNQDQENNLLRITL